MIAFSTDSTLRVDHQPKQPLQQVTLLNDDAVSPLFLAAIEATEEAIINSLLMSADMSGRNGSLVKGLPVKEVIQILTSYKRIQK